MKKVLLILTLLIFSYQNYSQDIVLTFDGIIENTGANAPLDRVVIENLTRGGFVELTSSFVFNLTGALEIQDVELKSNKPGFKKVYPNPFADFVNLEFYSEGVGTTTVNFYNLLGQQTARFSEKLNKGVHKLKFAPNASGVYLISLNDNGKNYFNKVIASQSNNNQKILSYIPNVSPSITAKNNSKAKVNSFFAEGDALKYTAYSGSLIDVIYDSPTVSKTVTFEFSDAYYRFEPYFIESNFPSFVDIMFSVTDANNKGVDYLDNPDFNVLENGSPVSPTETFRYVKKLDQVPYFQKTVIMLDNSSSVAVNLAQIKAAAISLVNKIVGDQEIAIYSFSDNAVLLQDFTTNVADLEAAINGITTGFPSTNLYGSLITGLDSFTNLYSLDRIEEGYLIALTDGDDTQGSSTLQQVIDARGKKRVFIAGLGNELNPAPLMQITSTGNYFPVTTAAELDDNFNQIWLDILQYSNSFYWLNYMTPKRTGTHDLTVEALNNTNINSDKNIIGTFPADGFQSVFSGVYANISPEKPYGVDWFVFHHFWNESIDLNASTYWAESVPEYTWSIDDTSIATLVVDPNNSSKVTVIQQGSALGSAKIILTDVANNFTKEIIVYLGSTSPSAILHPVTNITSSSATLNAEAIPQSNAGGPLLPITYRGIRWSIASNFFPYNQYQEELGPGKFSTNIADLLPNTIYYIKPYVGGSSGGALFGQTETFLTANGLPVVTTSVSYSDLTTTSFICNGSVDNDGGVPLSARGFVWSTSPNPTLADNFSVETGQLGAYSSSISNLPYDSTIYVRAYATNSFGTAYGDEIQVDLINQIYPNSAGLSTQAQIDAFGKIGYTGIKGSLNIIGFNGESTDISDLNPLSTLKTIGTQTSYGGIVIDRCSFLQSLNGLENITSPLKSISILSNEILSDINGLRNISSVVGDPNLNLGIPPGIKIDNNPSLLDLNALSNIEILAGHIYIGYNNMLTSLIGLNIKGAIDGTVRIQNNPKLINLEGLNGLTQARHVDIGNNEMLLNLSGLESLAFIPQNTSGYGLSVTENSNLENIEGLMNLVSAPRVIIRNSPKITSLNGLNNLVSAENEISIINTQITNVNELTKLTMVGKLSLSDNSKLENIDGLSNLTTLSDDLWINNSLITNVDALINLTSIGAINITASGNPNLINITGLSNITSVTKNLNLPNSLTDLNGLNNLTYVGGDFLINQLGLQNLDVLGSLKTVGGRLSIISSTLLNINGLSNLETVGSINISNTLISSIDALSGLTSIDMVVINNNNNLVNLDGFTNLTGTSAAHVEITNNNILKDFCGLRPLFSAVGGSVFTGTYVVSGNAYNPNENSVRIGSCSIP